MTATEERPAAEVGNPRRRKEDARLITGRTRWTDNIVLPGMLHLAMVRSPFAHARITRVDTEAARSASGVVAVYTGADLADEQGALPNAWAIVPDQKAPTHPSIAVDEVAFSGEIVAVVVARSVREARDAADLIDVDYEELPAALDLKSAAADEVLAHPDLGTNVSAFWKFDSAEAGTGQDVEAAISAARDGGIVIEREYRQQRLIPAFMEPRSIAVDPTGEQLTVWSSTQVPHFVRIFIALVLGISESKIRVIAPDVGGGFGGKLQFTPEEVLTVIAARRTGKPCKYTETRSESLMAAHHGRDQWQKLTLAATKDGTVTGLKVELLVNMGAYLGLVTSAIPILGAFMYSGIYKFPAYHLTCTNVFTNMAWTDAYRGAGRPEATFAVERLMDELAVEVGVDPMEIRERNWIKHEEFPFNTVGGMQYDSGNYEAATAKAKELFGYDELRAEQQARRASGDPVQLGIGISTYTEMCGLAPSRWLGSMGYVGGGWEHASVRMLPTGKVEVITGTSPHGQGHETAWSQIIADRLGVAFEDVEVLHGDTQVAARGLDTYGSRSLTVGAMAALAAADKVIEKAKPIAAQLLEAGVDDLEFSGGKFGVRGTDTSMTLGELAFAVFQGHKVGGGAESCLDADATLDPEHFSFPHGTHLCAVEVDTETGAAKIRSYVCVDDVGVVVNPLIVEGQVHGGLAQGIAQALFEEAVYDESGTLVTGTLVDYLVPSAADLSPFVTARTETPSTTNQLGVKGVGEAGAIA
ncbi:MAG TPA: xanthine dehydrogenase family protein molybdopterin-binding subunit, partial [Kribbella sp.]|nr:xanthine dehydrogenase family protein molybdopterin-binding subunit [Kribbella sp.]